MKILGIETSCDETAASVVNQGCFVLSNIIATSVKEHTQYGGVIPEIASRRQLEYIHLVVDKALKEARVNLNALDAIAVTQEPGLIGSLLVGKSFASGLAYSLSKPLIRVNHIQAHLYANRLVTGANNKKNQVIAKKLPSFPAIGLVVSGGHTSLFLMTSPSDIKEIGSTRDDAVGEAFDKVARIMKLGYPGGPIIDRLAKDQGAPTQLKFKSADLKNSYDFSFSGIKTAVLYHQQKNPNVKAKELAYAFQDSVINVLVSKSIDACRDYKLSTLMVGGGVAANSMLRQRLNDVASKHNINVSFPPMSLCLDNAAMIAGLAYHL